jgi:hypothetical protein
MSFSYSTIINNKKTNNINDNKTLLLYRLSKKYIMYSTYNSYTSQRRSIFGSDSNACSPLICWLSSKFVIPPSGTASSKLQTGQEKVSELRAFFITYSSRQAKHIVSKHGKILGFWKVP